VQDALDAIQYANGDTNTTWGALRAANGHPAPFNLKFMEIGNENGGSYYDPRYTLFYDAIKSNYPSIHLISPVWGSPSLPTSRPVEIQDEHYYSSAGTFISYATKYDSYSRSGPKIYVGEYAVTTGAGNGNLAGALGEAAFMIGLERNADIVAMASYAPLFANLNNKNWNPDLIYFNGTQVYGTPSYYVQQMFSRNRGDVVLPVTLAVTNTGGGNPLPHGAIGLGAWNTQVQYTNVVVTSNGVTLYQSDFTSGSSEWQVYYGTWSTSGGLYQQTANTTDCRSTTGNTNWSSYTLTLRARKTGGSEGFLILFNRLDDNNWTWWNIGGWNNTLDGIEQMVNGSKSLVGSQVSASIQNNQWYDIRIVLAGQRIQCYLNNVLIQDVSYPVIPPLLASASYSAASGQIILKAVNVSSGAITTTLSLNGLASVAPPASLAQLTSTSSLDENSLASPTKVFPVTTTITNAGTNFVYAFPANSLSILRLQMPPTLPIQVDLKVGTNLNDLASLPDGIPVGLNSFVTNAVAVDYRIETADGRFVTNGTFRIVPGILTTNLPLPATLLQPGTFFRVTLSNPVNSLLGGIPRGYFAADPLPGAPLKIGLALYPDETLVYWTDPTATLLEATNVIGPWTTNNNAANPVRIPDSPAAEFFRLMR
jgi:alpha-L-arabinofuranosidase